jgi:hypothetical protein
VKELKMTIGVLNQLEEQVSLSLSLSLSLSAQIVYTHLCFSHVISLFFCILRVLSVLTEAQVERAQQVLRAGSEQDQKSLVAIATDIAASLRRATSEDLRKGLASVSSFSPLCLFMWPAI